MSNIKTFGLILAFICFVVLEVAWISAAITVAGMLLLLAGVAVGLYEINMTGDMHWWFVLSTVRMLINGITYQFKESYRLVNEHKELWRKA